MSHPSIQANYLVLFDEEVKNEIEKNLEILFSNTEPNTLQNEVLTSPPPNIVSKVCVYSLIEKKKFLHVAIFQALTFS